MCCLCLFLQREKQKIDSSIKQEMPKAKDVEDAKQSSLSEMSIVADTTEKELNEQLFSLYQENTKNLANLERELRELTDKYSQITSKINCQFDEELAKDRNDFEAKKSDLENKITVENQKRIDDLERIAKTAQEDIDTSVRINTNKFNQELGDVETEITKLIDLAEGDHNKISSEAKEYESLYYEECKKRREISCELLDIKGDFYVCCYIKPSPEEEKVKIPKIDIVSNTQLKLIVNIKLIQ